MSEKESNGFVSTVLSSIAILVIVSLTTLSFWLGYDTDERRVDYQERATKIFNTFDKYKVDLKNKSLFPDDLIHSEFNKRSKAYFDRELLLDFRQHSGLVTIEAASQMLCFSINELVAGREFDLREYEKQYIGSFTNNNSFNISCHEYESEPYYVIKLKI